MNFMKTAVLLAALTALFGVVGYFLGGPNGMLIALGIAVVTNLFAYWNSDKLALSAHGAVEVDETTAPDLVRMVRDLSARAGLPMPRVYLIDNPQPNAFATGRNPEKAAVATTTGLMQMLSYEELAGVMAHELAHVKNRDVLIMTVASFFASVAAMIMQFGLFFGGGDDDDGAPAFLVVLLVSFVVYIFSFFLMLALSRYREFSADRGAALVTGRPSALSSALMRIAGAMETVPQQDLREAERMNAFFIVPTSVKGAIQTLFSTHPPMEKRIERLQQLERQLQGGTA